MTRHVDMQNTTSIELQRIFSAQKAAFVDRPMPEHGHRLEKLAALKNCLLRGRDEICLAVSEDFGHRSRMDTVLSDILPIILTIKHTRRHLKSWMRPKRRNPGWVLLPASLRVTYQPKGVVGIVVPWNFPIMLSLGPLIGALSAGNRAMIKMSEKTPQTNAIIKKMLAEVFDESEVAVIHGEIEIAKAFTSLPFDHLLFTGSTAVGREVMKAASEHLTPVTLELGGKSPLIVGPDIDAEVAAGRAMFGKCVNAAQICIAPDYAMLPRQKVNAFVAAGSRLFQQFYPEGIDSQDYTSVVDAAQYERLIRLMSDATAKGARIIPACKNARDDSTRRIATHFVLDVNDEMDVMQEEIFGPLFPVLPYDTIDQSAGVDLPTSTTPGNVPDQL